MEELLDYNNQNAIFAVDPETECRQIWFVSSTERDVLAMMFKAPEGWVLRYRFRHYNRKEDGSVDQEPWNEDRKSVYEMRIPEEGRLDEVAEVFTKGMLNLVEMIRADYDPEAYLWTKRVATGAELQQELLRAPFVHVRTVAKESELVQ